MTIKNGLYILCAAAALQGGVANAAGIGDLDGYIGGGIGSASIDDSRPSASASDASSLLIMRVGVYLSDYLSVEMRSGVNAGSGSKVEARNVVGFYLKPEVAVSDSLAFNAALGWGGVVYRRASGSRSRGGSASYGIGARYMVSDNLALTFDATRANKEKTIHADTYVVGLSYDFTL